MKPRFYLVAALLLCMWLPSAAQESRSYIKEHIKEWGSCRNVAITLTGGDLALNGLNEFAALDIPERLKQELIVLQNDGEYIDDVQLTEKGDWLILYGDCGVVYNNLPDGLVEMINYYNENKMVITTITFNDYGDWIIIAWDGFTASSTDIKDLIKNGQEEYGALISAHLNNSGLVLNFDRGYKTLGQVPDVVMEKLRETTFNVSRIKFLPDGTCFIADEKGERYSFYM